MICPNCKVLCRNVSRLGSIIKYWFCPKCEITWSS
jgi:Zn-finger nucleic acid-binding protein